MESFFYVENSVDINVFDLENLRLLYRPLVGNDGILLYEFLFDSNNLHHNQQIELNLILESLDFDENKLLEVKSRLESIGLIRSYNVNKNEFLFELIKPLSANQLVSNSFLSNQLIQKIGEDRYLRIVSAKINPKFDKSKMSECSRKAYEVYSNEDFNSILKNDKINILARNLNFLKKTATPDQFISSYTNLSLSPSQIKMIDKLKKLKFDNACINAFINYSINVNHSIVCAYIEKIATTYAHRNLFCADSIDLELSAAILAKQKNNSYNNKNKIYSSNDDDNELEWEN
ncbi:hypothetical protein DA803_02580 [[Mycoplasma] phocae]|uniref:Replicative helicase loading/DNA remodeling protein DnaB N-terminal winged helix domain-containing protein n=1 Tax=[Mycoplasma] phocae TaxID=142651 RepID=A0A2Z5IQD5_9BACT|nr:DnaD domain protein [[Mycoplasma] phocae]AXE60955.1 hypothetical protein DA803_02580 [[Mycoplasma] phocae]